MGRRPRGLGVRVARRRPRRRHHRHLRRGGRLAGGASRVHRRAGLGALRRARVPRGSRAPGRSADGGGVRRAVRGLPHGLGRLVTGATLEPVVSSFRPIVLVSGPLRAPVDTTQGPRHDEAGPGTQETDVKRILSAAAAAALGLCLLTACGDDGGDKAGGSGGDYCSDLKDAKKEVDALKGGDFSDLEKTTDAMNKLADEAPDEIKDDWEILVDGVHEARRRAQEGRPRRRRHGHPPERPDPRRRRHGGPPEPDDRDPGPRHRGVPGRRATTSTSTPRTSAGSTSRPDAGRERSDRGVEHARD